MPRLSMRACPLATGRVAAPDGTPAIFRHQLLHRPVEVVGRGERLLDEFGAQHLLADGEAAIEDFLVRDNSTV